MGVNLAQPSSLLGPLGLSTQLDTRCRNFDMVARSAGASE